MRAGVHGYIDSPSFAGTIGDIVPTQLKIAGGRTLDEFLRAEDREGFYVVLESFIDQLLTDPKNTDLLGRRLEESLTGAAVAGKSIADFLPEELVRLICSTVEGQVPQFLAQVAVMLSEPPMRDRIVLAIKGGMEDFIDGLGPMAAMAKGFIDMDTLDGTIRSWLEKKEDALAAWLQKPDIQERVSRTMAGRTRLFFATPLADVLVKIEPEQLTALCQRVAAQIMTALRSEGMRRAAGIMIREQLEEMIDHGRISLAEFAEMVVRKDRMENMQHTFSSELHIVLKSKQVRLLLDKVVNSMVDQVAAKPLGILQELMPSGVRDGITDYVVLTANRMLVQEVPGLVKSLNIKELVTEKVDSLDLERLERLLLSIMEEQFKYINLFGALLGFLIGCINLVVMLLY